MAMELDAALRLVAQPMDPGLAGAELTARVRSALLALLEGRRVAGLAHRDEEALRAWLKATYSGTADPAGALYQATLGRVIERTVDGRVTVLRSRKAHRATGAYYTQDTVVTYMLDRALAYMPEAATLVDPACGSGAFLQGARRKYGTGLALVGFDADPQALALCGQNVPDADLRQADALLDPLEGGYDLCLGNPPYISSGLRGAAAHEHQRLLLLKQRFGATAQYKVNTYPLFVERGLELLREGGVLGYILPDSFLSGRYFSGMRQLLLRHTLLELVLVREDFWEHGRVGQSVILFVRKAPPPAGHQVLVKVVQRVEELARTPGARVERQELVWGPLQRFRLIPDAGDRAFVQRMEAGASPLTTGDLLHTYSGLIARNGQSSFLKSANPNLAGPWGRLLRSGKEIDRYRLAWAGEEVCLDPGLIKSGGYLPYYQGPKLLLRQTADSLRAVYDKQGFYCLNNIHVLVPKGPETDLRMLLAILNAEPFNRYYKAMTMETGRLYAQVDLDLLESIPLPHLSTETGMQLAWLARQRESATPEGAALVEQQIDQLVLRSYSLT